MSTSDLTNFYRLVDLFFVIMQNYYYYADFNNESCLFLI